MKRIINKNTVLLILLCAAASCIHEAEPGWGKTDGPLPVKLNLHLPSNMKGDASVRSIADEDESDITSVQLLAFLDNGSGVFQYQYSAPIESTENTNGQVEIVATAQGYTRQQVFMVLVNAPSGTSSGIVQNMSLAAARQQLLVTEANEWNATSSADYKPLPMYAETLPSTITAGTTLGDYDLVRMIARIDVRLKEGVSNFEITEAHIFNRKTSGQMAFPFDATTWDVADKRVLKTTYPQAMIPNAYKPSYYDYPGFTYTPYKADNTVDARGEILRSIYTFEANGVLEADRLEATAVIVGGKYNGSTDVTYYRVDIVTPSTPVGNCSQDILRNHLYDIEIQNIAVAGFPTPEDAFIGKKTIEFTVSVTNWGTETHFPLGLKIQPSENCYIVAPGETFGIPAFGQVQRAMDAEHLPSTWIDGSMKLKPFLVWAEYANVINTSDLKLGFYKSHNIVYSTLLSVTTGNTEGNALVAVYHDKNDDGVYDSEDEIKWSWHIWVMADINQPQEVSGWMDRDLGMLRRTWVGTPGNKNGDPAIPLYYQWGRKEPFTQTGTEIAEPAGRLWGAGTYTSVTSGTGNTLAEALQHPARVITDWSSPSGMYCWRTQSDEKGIHDPCPAGYRVPSTTDWGPLLGTLGVNFTTSSNNRVLIQTVTGLEWVLPLNYDFWYHSHSRSSTDGCRYDVAVGLNGSSYGRIEYRTDGGEPGQRAGLYPVRCIKE